jgi:ElaB/YqjD/DUF883 family membrane-anchored ribosome-binding protein
MERLDSSQNTPQEVEVVEVVDLTEPSATVDVTDATMSGRSTTGQGDSGMDQAKERAKGTAAEAKDQAKGVAQEAKEQAKGVTQEAKGQVRSVAQTAGQQTRGLLSGVGHEVSSEVESQKGRLAQMLRELSDELEQAAGRTEGADGRVATFAGEAATRTREASSWIESHQARDLVDSVSDFARRRPMLFIAGSAIAGLVVGRLTRGMVDAARDQGDGQQASTTGTGYAAGYATGSDYGAGTAGEAPVSGYGYSVPAGSTGAGTLGTAGTEPFGSEPTPGAMADPDDERNAAGTGTPGTLGGLP